MEALFINACVRENSRTKKLADALLEKMNCDVQEVKLETAGVCLIDGRTLERREKFIGEGIFDDELFRFAKQFAQSETVVIAAPYWDLSFPALLKAYIENIMIRDLTFKYECDGTIINMCNVKRIFYVSTAGGPVIGENEGFRYIKTVAETFFDVKEFCLIQEENLDIAGFDANKIVADKIDEIKNMEL